MGPATISTHCEGKQKQKKKLSQELLHWYRLEKDDFLLHTVNGGESRIHHYAIHDTQSLKCQKCQEIQMCSFSQKSRAHHFLGCRGHDLRRSSDYRKNYDHASNACAESGLKEDKKFLRITTMQAQIKETATSLKFTFLPHPPYCPDLASSNFWLFPKWEEKLKNQHFSLDATAEAAVNM